MRNFRVMRTVDGRWCERRWFWTPYTYSFGHGGWVCLRLRWLRRFWGEE
jgi:hypothetical protein